MSAFHKIAALSCGILLGCWLVPRAVHSGQPSPTSEALGTQGTTKDWPIIGGNTDNMRYSTLSQINLETVKSLGGAWVSKNFDDGALSRAAPVIQEGRIFVTAGSRVYAYDAKTGERLWSFRTDESPGPSATETVQGETAVIFSGRGLPDNQGVAVGEGLVFVGLLDGHVIALDANTGHLVWSHQLGDEDPPKLGQSASNAPIYSKGIVFSGMANGDLGVRGRVVALDAKTGRELWHFMMVPGPREIGHDSWPSNTTAWKFGGAGVWQEGAADPDLGLVYFGGGNAVPQWGGELRAGNNLFTNAIVALDMQTGKLKWYYQVLHHELWDADIGTPPVLYNAEMRDGVHKGLAVMRSDGFLFLLDRETGKPLIPIEERSVPQSAFLKTSPTQPFPVGADSLEPDCSSWKGKLPAGFTLGCSFAPPSMPPPSKDPQNVLAPGFGVRIAPFAYSPETHYFYATGSTALGWRLRSTDPYYFSTRNGGHLPVIPEDLRPGVMAAIDSRTDRIVWKKEIPPSILGRSGALVTRGGLMFHAGGDGNFQAFDAKTGDLVWQFQTGNAGTGGPAASYEAGGDQYVTFVSGPALWGFKLGGRVEPLPAPKAATPPNFIVGPIEDSDHVETASLLVNSGDLGTHWAVAEYLFSPFRARVEAGTKVSWKNNGSEVHTIIAQDGSWTTGRLEPTDVGFVVFDKPGTYTYICKEHPWSYGQIIVVPKRAKVASGSDAAIRQSNNREDQAKEGKALYAKSCAACHQPDLTGRDPAPALAGEAFLLRWQQHAVADLFDRIRTTMPPNASDRLSDDAYLDIVAYLLDANNLSAGSETLKAGAPALSEGLTSR